MLFRLRNDPDAKKDSDDNEQRDGQIDAGPAKKK
jgi:hypothetical protein